MRERERIEKIEERGTRVLGCCKEKLFMKMPRQQAEEEKKREAKGKKHYVSNDNLFVISIFVKSMLIGYFVLMITNLNDLYT